MCRYIQLLGVVPTDAVIEKRLGEMLDADGDKTEAYNYFFSVRLSHRHLHHLCVCHLYMCHVIRHDSDTVRV